MKRCLVMLFVVAVMLVGTLALSGCNVDKASVQEKIHGYAENPLVQLAIDEQMGKIVAEINRHVREQTGEDLSAEAQLQLRETLREMSTEAFLKGIDKLFEKMEKDGGEPTAAASGALERRKRESWNVEKDPPNWGVVNLPCSTCNLQRRIS